MAFISRQPIVVNGFTLILHDAMLAKFIQVEQTRQWTSTLGKKLWLVDDARCGLTAVSSPPPPPMLIVHLLRFHDLSSDMK
jgi:hypothetical protein